MDFNRYNPWLWFKGMRLGGIWQMLNLYYIMNSQVKILYQGNMQLLIKREIKSQRIRTEILQISFILLNMMIKGKCHKVIYQWYFIAAKGSAAWVEVCCTHTQTFINIKRIVLTFKWDKQFCRKICQLFKKNCFWLTHNKQVISGYKACLRRKITCQIYLSELQYARE